MASVRPKIKYKNSTKTSKTLRHPHDRKTVSMPPVTNTPPKSLMEGDDDSVAAVVAHNQNVLEHLALQEFARETRKEKQIRGADHNHTKIYPVEKQKAVTSGFCPPTEEETSDEKDKRLAKWAGSSAQGIVGFSSDLLHLSQLPPPRKKKASFPSFRQLPEI